MARRGLGIAAILGVSVATLVIAAADPNADRTSPSEMIRLKAHFDTVLRELRAADVSRLAPKQQAARAELISRLEGYALAGRFPHNHVIEGRRIPVFRDEHQTLCAMGFLITSTGRTDIVDDVARTANLARIPELASDSRLRAWLDSAGLTVAEAARIQPMYGCIAPGCVVPIQPQPTPTPESHVQAGYYVGSAAVSALSGATIALNLLSHAVNPTFARRTSAIGFVAGAAQIALGAFVLDQNATARAVGVANMAMGASSMATSIWRVRQLRSQPAPSNAKVSLVPQPESQGASVMVSLRM